MLGALSLVCILFADDVVLLARCIADLQKLLNAFSDFCNTLHEQIALDKTEAVLFTPKSCNFSVRDGNLYRNVSRSVSREIRLELKQQPVKWSSFFKYLGSPISGNEGLSFLEDSVVAQVVKICGSLGSACRSAVALPLSRIVDLNQSLVTPIALLNCVAWVPFLKQGGPWYSSMCNHWWGVVGLKPQPGKDYVLLSWLDFGTWDLTAAKMLLKFTGQMVRAPPGSFLAELLTELRRECLRPNNYDAWLFGVLRLLSLGLSFRRDACLVARVDSMLERIRDEKLSFLVQIFGENFAARALSDARSRLAGRPAGPNQKMYVLKAWVGQEANPPPRFRVRTLPFSRGSFNLLARLVLGELPVGRTRAVYQHRSSLSDFGKSWFGKRACLHCFLEKDTLVLDSEWHWIFDCPKCNGIRAKHPYLRDSLESIRSNSEYAELNDLCKLLNAIQIDSRLGFSVVSFVRQAITLREKWMGDACVRGRLCNTPGHWGRNLIRFPPSAEELPLDFEQAFWKGWPWIFSNESRWFSNDE